MVNNRQQIQSPQHSIYTTKRIYITTPEGVTISLTLAGPASRFLALLIDYIFIIIIMKVINILAGAFSPISPQISISFIILLQLIVSFAYFISFEWLKNGRTPGKHLLRLRVIDKNGFLLSNSQIVLRNLFRIIDSMPILYMVGGIVSTFSVNYQRIGDMVASTVVIYDRHFVHNKINEIVPNKFNSFYSYPHLMARARQHITPTESSMLLKALMRRNKLSPESRIKLYNTLTGYFKAIVEFPVQDISNEQYLKNLLEILYSRKKITA